MFTVLVAKVTQAFFPIHPVNTMLLFLGKLASVANTVLIEMDGRLLGIFGVLVLDS